MRWGILGDEDTSTLTSRFAMARDLRMLGQVRHAHEILCEIDLALARKPVVSPQFRLLVGADLAVSLRRCGYRREALIQAEDCPSVREGVRPRLSRCAADGYQRHQ